MMTVAERDLYRKFLDTKALLVAPKGVEIDPSQIHPTLMSHQRDQVIWAARKGRAGFFAAVGLGKSRTFIETARLVCKRALIVVPLGVVKQTIYEGEQIGVPITSARTQEDAAPTGLTVTNYEVLRHFDPDDFDGVVCDEGSILKDFEGATRSRLIKMFEHTPYRWVATATPSPNDVVELANYAEFLGIMPRTQMLATWFYHDDQGYHLRGHAREPFYRWLATWAMTLKRPSDLGYSDAGYILPPLTIYSVIVPSNYVPEGMLMAVSLKGITDRSRARKGTITERVAAAKAIIDKEPDEQWTVWCGLNAEQDSIAKALGDRCVSVYGSLSADEKVARLDRWLAGEVRVMVTKGALFGHGLNLQNCARVLFLGLNDSFEMYHQIIGRHWRFGQKRPVHAYVVLTDVEEVIYANVLRKEREFDAMTNELVKRVAAYERAELHQQDARPAEPPRQVIQLPAWLT